MIVLTNGFVSLHRKILEWEWYSDIPTTRLFIHLLLTVNFKESQYKGIDVPRGARVCSFASLSKETGLTVMQVRTALNHLETTETITRSSHSKFTIISIKNYDNYQTDNTINNKQITKKQQTNNKQVTNKQQQNNKEIRKQGNKEIKEDALTGENIPDWIKEAMI